MAEQRNTPQTNARVSTQHRRNMSSVERDPPARPTHSPSSSTASSMTVSNGPRLKARVKPTEIVQPGSLGSATTPRLRRTPSSVSGGGRSDNAPSYGRPRSPVSTSSRSSVGNGPATPTSASSQSQIGKSKATLVAKGQTSRTGTPSATGGASASSSVVSTPTYRRTASAVNVATSSSVSTPSRSPPLRRSPPNSAVGASSRPQPLGLSSMGTRFKSALSGNDQPEPPNSAASTNSNGSTLTVVSPTTRVHVRGSSPSKLPISPSSGPRSPRLAPGFEESTASTPIPPASGRAASARPMQTAERHSPLSCNTVGPSSNLMEVTPSWANQTMHQPPTSSSLLSPSTLIPSVRPPTPPPIGLEGEEASVGGLRPAFAPFGTATLSSDVNNIEPSSNHSSPVRPTLPLEGPSPLRAHFPHLNLQHHPTASCPTSPTPGDRSLGPNIAPRRPSRSTLPWNPNSTLSIPFHVAPESPELRTVALPLMTPTRSPDSADDYVSPASQGMPIVARVRSFGANGQLTNMSSMSRRYSSSSGSESDDDDDDYGSSSRSALSINKQRSDRDRMSGSTIAEDDDEDDMGDVKMDELENAVFSDEEKAKVNRKIADLEISNASLMTINRTLEATKAKQRTEILKLRRMLRESQAGLVRPVNDAAPAPIGPTPSLARVLSTDDEGGGWGDDEMDDPELEARWDRLALLVGAMRKRGEDAVERGKEETKPAMQRVLGWLEVEALTSEVSPDVSSSQFVSAAQSEADVDTDNQTDIGASASELLVGSDRNHLDLDRLERERDRREAIGRDHDDDLNYHTDATGFTDVTQSTNLSAASNATQLAGELLERGQRY